MLEQTLEEEKQADEKLTQLSQEINPKAAEAGEGEEITSKSSHEGRGGIKSRKVV